MEVIRGGGEMSALTQGDPRPLLRLTGAGATGVGGSLEVLVAQGR